MREQPSYCSSGPPAAPPPDRKALPDEAFAFAGETRRVLIADDNRDWADGLALVLEEKGYRVRTAYDGREALDAACEFQPHVVILDVWMPNMTGFEAGRVFHRHPSRTRPVLIAITGWPQQSVKLRATMAGFDHYLGKSATSTDILELLKNV